MDVRRFIFNWIMVAPTTHSTKVVRAAGLSVSIAVSSPAASSPGASSAPVSPTSRTSALSPPCISTSPDASAAPPEMRTSGSAIARCLCAAKTFVRFATGVFSFSYYTTSLLLNCAQRVLDTANKTVIDSLGDEMPKKRQWWEKN